MVLRGKSVLDAARCAVIAFDDFALLNAAVLGPNPTPTATTISWFLEHTLDAARAKKEAAGGTSKGTMAGHRLQGLASAFAIIGAPCPFTPELLSSAEVDLAKARPPDSEGIPAEDAAWSRPNALEL